MLAAWPSLSKPSSRTVTKPAATPVRQGQGVLFDGCGIPYRQSVHRWRVWGDPDWLKSAPRHRNVAHQQATVEDRTAWGQPVRVIEEPGTYAANLDSLSSPRIGRQSHAPAPPPPPRPPNP